MGVTGNRKITKRVVIWEYTKKYFVCGVPRKDTVLDMLKLSFLGHMQVEMSHKHLELHKKKGHKYPMRARK